MKHMKQHRSHHHFHHHSRPRSAAQRAPTFALAGLIITALGLSFLAYRKNSTRRKEISMSDQFQLTSPAFDNGEPIPVRYTCKGANVSPPLDFSGVPDRTRSLAVILHDPDAPGGDYLHWTMWDIHPGITNIPEEAIPIGARTGLNDFSNEGYDGPCPPTGTHRYEFEAYALDAMLGLAAGSERAVVAKAIEKHTIAKSTLAGSFTAS
jgi:Raf kinase inhibitor-like YbhB/YbcL family protein